MPVVKKSFILICFSKKDIKIGRIDIRASTHINQEKLNLVEAGRGKFTMRVLVVEDEERMTELIRQGLKEEAYAVDVVYDGQEALQWLRTSDYDLIILDIMLPGVDGLEVCREYRSRGGRARILMLTARDTMKDRVHGLDSGADDYLVKPFGMPELLARLRALSRRDGPSRTSELHIDDLTLDTVTKRVARAGRSIELTAIEYAVLELLMRHPGQVLSREQIIDHVWNADFDSGSKLIEVYIYHLRRKLDDGQGMKLIHTVRGLGYKMDGDGAA
jgi:two-component system OmpR family response regulator